MRVRSPLRQNFIWIDSRVGKCTVPLAKVAGSSPGPKDKNFLLSSPIHHIQLNCLGLFNTHSLWVHPVSSERGWDERAFRMRVVPILSIRLKPQNHSEMEIGTTPPAQDQPPKWDNASRLRKGFFVFFRFFVCVCLRIGAVAARKTSVRVLVGSIPASENFIWIVWPSGKVQIPLGWGCGFESRPEGQNFLLSSPIHQIQLNCLL